MAAVQGHQRDAGAGIELVGVGRQRGVVEELGECFAANLGIVGGVGQFLQVFNPAEGLRRAFGLERLDVAGAIDEEANQLGKRGGIAGLAKGFLILWSGSMRSSRLPSPGLANQRPGAPGLSGLGICRNGRTFLEAKGFSVNRRKD